MRHITPDMPRDVAARILYEEAGDINARWKLVNLAELAFNGNRKKAAASLIHAYEYLTDREAYQRSPWPKNMVKFDIPACRHGSRGTQ